jgi:polysaccharide export outer membrane protein
MVMGESSRFACWLVAAAALLGGCAATGEVPVEAGNAGGVEMITISEAQPAAQPVSAQPVYRFYPGDELAVIAVRRPELSVTARVDPYGYIAYPYLGQVKVQDLTAAEVAEHLTRGLREGDFYTSPVLSVSLVSAKEQFVYVLGEVKKPGAVTITGSMPLLAAISSAGGQTHDAEMSTVLWIRGRQSPPGVVKLDLAAFGDPRTRDPKIANLTLIPGDVLYVPDSVIASVERFMKRIFNILAPIVLLEQGLVLYPEVERFLRGEDTGRQNQIILTR